MRGAALPFLAAGRVPSRWARGVSHQVARQARLQRVCVWVQELTSPLPKLCGEPLWGTYLAALTSQVDSTTESASEVSRSAKPRSSDLGKREGTVKGPRTQSHLEPPKWWLSDSRERVRVSSERWLRRDVRAPTGLPRQASPALLNRLYDRDLRLGERSYERDPSLPRARAKRVSPSSQSLDSNRSSRGELNGGQLHVESASLYEWQDNLVKRTRRALHRFGASGSGSLAQAPLPVAVAEPGEAFFSGQWSLPIAGPTAPSELLIQWSGRAQLNDFVASGRDQKRMSSNSASDGRPAQTAAVAEKASNRSHKGIELPSARREIEKPLQASPCALGPKRNQLPSARGGTQKPLQAIDEDDEHQAERAGGANALVERITPPTLLSPLPPLIPPDRVGTPVTPVAMATVRQGAQSEAIKAEENLNILAAKIKRILDEEARRHGIDV